jgi:hypothetical protein
MTCYICNGKGWYAEYGVGDMLNLKDIFGRAIPAISNCWKCQGSGKLEENEGDPDNGTTKCG